MARKTTRKPARRPSTRTISAARGPKTRMTHATDGPAMEGVLIPAPK